MSKTATSSAERPPLYAVVRVSDESPTVVAHTISDREKAFRQAERRSEQLPSGRYCVKTHTALLDSIGGRLTARWGR